jgi:hypothetical protein
MEAIKRKVFGDYYDEDKYIKKLKEEELIPLNLKSKEVELYELDKNHEKNMQRISIEYESLRKKFDTNYWNSRNKIESKYKNMNGLIQSPVITEKGPKSRNWDIPKNQNCFEDGKYACLCISMIAIQTFLLDKEVPIDFKWENIIRNGIEIYKIWLEFKDNNGNNSKFSYPHSGEILNVLKQGNLDQGLYLIKDIGGHLIDNQVEKNNMPKAIEDAVFREEYHTPSFSTLDQTITEMQITPNSAIVFTINEYTISIFQSKHNSYKGIWLYDSHRNTDSPDPNCSTLYLFYSKQDLIKYIRTKHHNYVSRKEDINIFHAALFSYKE